AGCNTSPRFTRRRSAAATMIAMAVFAPIRVIGVPGSEHLPEIVVLGRVNVRVIRDHGNRGAGGDALIHTGEDLGAIPLVARRRDLALANTATIQLMLDLLDRERQAGRHSFDHHAKRRSMGFAPGRQLEDLPEAT